MTEDSKPKPLDLTNLLRHAFLSGRGVAKNGKVSEADQFAWVSYDPSEQSPFLRIEAHLAALAAAPVNASRSGEEEPPYAPVKLTYRNWRGEVSERTITPKRVWFGPTDWHPEAQWLLTAFDHDKQADHDFALADFVPTPRQSELVAALREALEPFAEQANAYDEPDNEWGMLLPHEDRGFASGITIGQLRAARAARAALATPGLVESGRPFPGDDLDKILGVLEEIEYVANNDIRAAGAKTIRAFVQYAKAILPRVRSALATVGVWQDISTAPKVHGEIILAPNRYGALDLICWDEATGGWDDGFYHHGGGDTRPPLDPKIWQPAPVLPAPTPTEGV